MDDSPLTANGREQASGNGALLKEVAGDLSGFDFFASPIHRTCNTMELVREAAGLPPTGYRADHRLMEIQFGDHTWMTREEIASIDPLLPGLDDKDDWDYAPHRHAHGRHTGGAPARSGYQGAHVPRISFEIFG